MSISPVRLAFENALQSVPGVPDIAWENIIYAPENDQPFIRPKLVMTSNENPIISGNLRQQRMNGVYFIDIFTPSRKGPQLSDSLTGNVLNLFYPGSFFDTDNGRIHVSRNRLANVMQDDTWFHVPISVEWYRYYNPLL